MSSNKKILLILRTYSLNVAQELETAGSLLKNQMIIFSETSKDFCCCCLVFYSKDLITQTGWAKCMPFSSPFPLPTTSPREKKKKSCTLCADYMVIGMTLENWTWCLIIAKKNNFRPTIGSPWFTQITSREPMYWSKYW